MKDIIILAGPNGAGKTTAAQKLVPKKLGITEFVNADEIARGLSPFNADAAALAAGRVMIGRMRYLIHTGTSFAFETTCAGKGHIGMLRQCKSDGWRITLLYLWLPSPDHALDRVVRSPLRWTQYPRRNHYTALLVRSSQFSEALSSSGGYGANI